MCDQSLHVRDVREMPNPKGYGLGRNRTAGHQHDKRRDRQGRTGKPNLAQRKKKMHKNIPPRGEGSPHTKGAEQRASPAATGPIAFVAIASFPAGNPAETSQLAALDRDILV